MSGLLSEPIQSEQIQTPGQVNSFNSSTINFKPLLSFDDQFQNLQFHNYERRIINSEF